MTRSLTFALITALALLARAAAAQHHGDVLLEVIDGRIVTSLIDEKSGEVTPGVRIFAAEFGDTGTPTFTSNPGFDSEPGTFPVPSAIGFNVLEQLHRWTGDGFEATANETITISFAATTVSTADGFVAGFTLPVSASGQWHRHLGYTLASPGAPEPGIYLLELELFSTSPRVDASEPFWKVFNFQASEEDHLAAIEWAERNLADPGCFTDLNGDCVVNAADLAILLGSWSIPAGSPGCDGALSCLPDLNDDGLVNAADLAILLGAWTLP